MSDIDDKFKPVLTGELSDLDLLPGEFRAFRSEVRDSLAAIARALQTLGRIEERLDVVIDRQNLVEKRLDAVEREQADAARARNALSDRITALEKKPTRTRIRK